MVLLPRGLGVLPLAMVLLVFVSKLDALQPHSLLSAQKRDPGLGLLRCSPGNLGGPCPPTSRGRTTPASLISEWPDPAQMWALGNSPVLTLTRPPISAAAGLGLVPRLPTLTSGQLRDGAPASLLLLVPARRLAHTCPNALAFLPCGCVRDGGTLGCVRTRVRGAPSDTLPACLWGQHRRGREGCTLSRDGSHRPHSPRRGYLKAAAPRGLAFWGALGRAGGASLTVS